MHVLLQLCLQLTWRSSALKLPKGGAYVVLTLGSRSGEVARQIDVDVLKLAPASYAPEDPKNRMDDLAGLG